MLIHENMKKKDFFGIIYVSLLIIIWGSIGSLIDYALLQSSIYVEGSIGQFSTFLITGIVFSFLGVKLFPISERYVLKEEE